jgi:hypothetical protein
MPPDAPSGAPGLTRADSNSHTSPGCPGIGDVRSWPSQGVARPNEWPTAPSHACCSSQAQRLSQHPQHSGAMSS